jgi:hypothetical protein
MRNDDNDHALLGRLRHLIHAARTMHQRDRRSVLALEADIRILRGALSARCDALTERMRAAGTRTAAISAYARIGSIARGPHIRLTTPTD